MPYSLRDVVLGYNIPGGADYTALEQGFQGLEYVRSDLDSER